MDRIDMDRLKTGEVNLGVSLSSLYRPSLSTWTLADIHHGRPVRQRRRRRRR